MSISVNTPASNVTIEYHAGQWISKNSAIVKPEVRAELYQKYGKGIGARDLIFAAGNVIDVPNQTITIGVAESPLSVVEVYSEIAVGASGATIALYLAAADFDTNGNGPLAVGDDIYIPKTYMPAAVTSDRAYRVMSASGTTTSRLFTCMPYAKDLGYYATASKIDTAVPAGTKLSVGANSFAPGTLGTSGKTDTFETRTFSNRILKEALDFEGGQVAKSYYEFSGYEGDKKLLSENITRAEFRLDVKEARAFWASEWADNTGLVQTNQEAIATTAVPSFGGMWPHADKYAQKLAYTGEFNIDNLYDAGILLQSRGVVKGGTNLFLVGPELERDVEKSVMDYIKQFSGGTDLLDKVKKEIGIDVQAFKLNGRTYVLWAPNELADPTGFGLLNSTGNGVYSTAKAGLIVPNVPVTVGEFNGKKNVTIPNVQLGYVNHNGENRRRKIGYLKGMSQLLGGQDIATSYDADHIHMLVHMTGIFAAPDMWIQVYS